MDSNWLIYCSFCFRYLLIVHFLGCDFCFVTCCSVYCRLIVVFWGSCLRIRFHTLQSHCFGSLLMWDVCQYFYSWATCWVDSELNQCWNLKLLVPDLCSSDLTVPSALHRDSILILLIWTAGLLDSSGTSSRFILRVPMLAWPCFLSVTCYGWRQ